MTLEARANLIGGRWCPARSGAAFSPGFAGPARRGEAVAGAEELRWPQSGPEDVAEALERARSLERLRRGLPSEAVHAASAMASELERDPLLIAALCRALGLREEELAPHVGDLGQGLGAELEALLARDLDPGPAALALVAPDWRELVRGALREVARELVSGRAVMLFSDPRLPVVAERVAAAALAAGLRGDALALLHGTPRELLALAVRAGPCALSASGSAERMVELRRLSESAGIAEPRLRALRCGAFELDPARDLEQSAAQVIEGAFARSATLSGQLPGQIARVFCPERVHSRFTELLLAGLEASEAARSPLAQIDFEAEARARAAWELGLAEGATLIAGGELDEGAAERVVPPAVLTNVEPYMASARRAEPLPVLCLLRANERATGVRIPGRPGEGPSAPR